MKKKELSIMKHLRLNARESLTRMSRKTGIPVSTIYERLKQFEDNVIRKHTCILDFAQLGYDLRMTLLLATKKQEKDAVQQFLSTHEQVNTVLKINNGFDFLVEAVFRNMSEVQIFLDTLDKTGVSKRKEFYVLEEIQREAFLTSEAHLQLLISD